MTREDVKRQVLARVNVASWQMAYFDEVMDAWLGLYSQSFKFGPESVQAGVRLVTRKINQFGREQANRRTEEEAKKG